MTKSPRKNVPDVGIELGAACMPSGHASDRATASGCSSSSSKSSSSSSRDSSSSSSSSSSMYSLLINRHEYKHAYSNPVVLVIRNNACA